MNRQDKFTVSGPGVEQRVTAAALGLSRAINLASAASRARREESYYVRNPAGEVVGRTDATADGCVSVYGERWFA